MSRMYIDVECFIWYVCLCTAQWQHAHLNFYFLQDIDKDLEKHNYVLEL